MVGLRALRAATGRLSWVAGILPRCRWAVSILYAVVSSAEADEYNNTEWVRAAMREGDQRPKTGLVPMNRIKLPVEWFVMLLTKPDELLMRREKLVPDLPSLALITDASPQGIGAVLAIVDLQSNRLTPIAAMDSRVTEEDARWLGVPWNEAASQGALEAWAILLAVRMWSAKIKQYPGPVLIKSDSTVALAMATKLSSPSPTVNWVGAELGLRLEHLGVPRLIGHHLPGILNTCADWLSRPHGRAAEPPAELNGLKIVHFSDSKRRSSLLPPPGVDATLWGKNPQTTAGAFDHL
eukprot:Skav211927  [mRNA]  locus=scaffold1086:171492:172376:+ [translate_table: standard]